MPPGFVVTTETCKAFFEAGKMLPPGLKEEYMEALAKASFGSRRAVSIHWGFLGRRGPVPWPRHPTFDLTDFLTDPTHLVSIYVSPWAHACPLAPHFYLTIDWPIHPHLHNKMPGGEADGT